MKKKINKRLLCGPHHRGDATTCHVRADGNSVMSHNYYSGIHQQYPGIARGHSINIWSSKNLQQLRFPLPVDSTSLFQTESQPSHSHSRPFLSQSVRKPSVPLPSWGTFRPQTTLGFLVSLISFTALYVCIQLRDFIHTKALCCCLRSDKRRFRSEHYSSTVGVAEPNTSQSLLPHINTAQKQWQNRIS